MMESWFIEEVNSQEGWGMDFSSIMEGETNEADWIVGFVFSDKGSWHMILTRIILVSYITIWD
jgi:hypothetical protein